MENTAQKVVGFKKKMKISNDYNSTIGKLSRKQNETKTNKQKTECRLSR